MRNGFDRFWLYPLIAAAVACITIVAALPDAWAIVPLRLALVRALGWAIVALFAAAIGFGAALVASVAVEHGRSGDREFYVAAGGLAVAIAALLVMSLVSLRTLARPVLYFEQCGVMKAWFGGCPESVAPQILLPVERPAPVARQPATPTLP